MERIEVATVGRSGDTEIRIGIQEFLGERVIDVRIWKRYPKEKDFSPTQKGVTIPVAQANDVSAAILLAKSKIISGL